MKFTAFLVLAFFMNFSFAQTPPKPAAKAPVKKTAAKKPKKDGRMTLRADLDYNPKLLAVVVPNIKKKNNFTVTIEVSNNTKIDRMAKVVFYEYNPNENGINILSKSKANVKRPDLSLNDYIKYNRDPFVLKSNTKMLYKFDLELPKDIKGTKYAYYTVEEVPMINYVEASKIKKGSGSAVTLSLSYLSPLVVDIADSGEKKIDTTIKYFPVQNLISVDAKNIGDHYIRVPKVNLVLLNDKNEFVEKISLNAATDQIKNLHPTCHIPYIYRLPRGLKPGKYRAIVAVSADEGLFVHSQEHELIVAAGPEKPQAVKKNKGAGSSKK